VIRSTIGVIYHTSKAVHRVLHLAIALLVIASCLLTVGAWRLAQGPIALDWLSDRVKAALIDDTASVRVSFDKVSLAWEGFHKGADYPLDLRLSNIIVTGPAGRQIIAAPQAHLTFSLARLLLGQFVPRAIEVDHAQITVTRQAGGAIDLGWMLVGGDVSTSGTIDIPRIEEQLARPVGSDRARGGGLFDQIKRAHFRDTDLILRDQPTGLIVRALGMDLDLVRNRPGHVSGSLRTPLSIGDRQADLTAQMDWSIGSNANLDLKLTSARPVSVGIIPPAAGGLDSLDVPISLMATIGFDSNFAPKQVRAEVRAGVGHIQIGSGRVPLRSGILAFSGSPKAITITKGHIDVAPTIDGDPQIIDLAGAVTYTADRFAAALTIGLAQINIADLPLLWPTGIGGGARPWIVEHVTGGVVTHAMMAVVVEADGPLQDIVITKASGDLDVSNGTFTWIDNVPPVEQADVHLHLVDPDTLDIHLSAGRQRIRNSGTDLLIRDGQMRITGLTFRDQIAVIHTQLEGPVASALTLLKEPRLHLLSTHPIALQIAGGNAAATLDFQLPLENKLSIDDVEIHAKAHLKDITLLDVANGHALKDGIFDLAIDKEGLTLKGQGTLAAVPVTLDGTMDFKPGTGDQVVQKIAVTGQPNAEQLDAAGLHIKNVVTGPIPLTAVLLERRNGESQVAITGDLTRATLSIDALAWRKPAAGIANVSATLIMAHGQLTKIDRIVVSGDGLRLTGSANFIDGQCRSVLLDTIRLGRTQGHGTVRLAPETPIAVVLQGEQLDLSPKLTEKISSIDRSKVTDVITPLWTLDARFNRAILANGERADDLLVKAVGGGDMIRLLDAVGFTQAGSGFSIKITEPLGSTPKANQRRLLIDSKDAGTFLRGMDISRSMQSGHLKVDGMFNRPFGLYPLTATAVIDDSVVRNSPVLGKLLQAITLYGLVDALSGPGMSFSKVVVPFHYNGEDLEIGQAHADNPSLGLTGKGRLGVSSGRISMTGTIVPAYFFNSMLGHLPLIGKLFSPEKGGGIFAVNFGLNGLIEDPDVSINPVSALTPGFLREIFTVFDHTRPTNNQSSPQGKQK
jgi:hypothetical protein